MIVEHIYLVLNTFTCSQSGVWGLFACFCFVCLFLNIRLRGFPFVFLSDLEMAPLAKAKYLFEMCVHRLVDNTNW